MAGWCNFVYPTDPIAARVGLDTVDVPLPDPADSYFVYGQPPPSVGGHSGYWADERVWTAINGMAADFRQVPPPSQDPGDPGGHAEAHPDPGVTKQLTEI